MPSRPPDTQIFVSLLLTYEEQGASRTQPPLQSPGLSLKLTCCPCLPIAARYDPSLWDKTVAAAKSVVQLIQLIANVDCEPPVTSPWPCYIF